MTDKPIIEATRTKYMKITIQYVFRASFNDTMWLEEVKYDLAAMDREKLTWFDPFNGRSNRGNTMAALAYCSDERFAILEKVGDEIHRQEAMSCCDCIISEDYNEHMLLAAHISME